MIVLRHPIAHRVRAVGIEEEGRVQHFVAHDRCSRTEHTPNFAEHARRIADMLEDPTEERTVEALGLEVQARGVALDDVIAPVAHGAVAKKRRASAICASLISTPVTCSSGKWRSRISVCAPTPTPTSMSRQRRRNGSRS